MVNFTEPLTFRAVEGTEDFINKLCAKYPHRWDDKSNFLRAATAVFIRQLRRKGIFLAEEVNKNDRA